MSRQKKITIKRAALAFDLMMLLAMAVFVGYLFGRTPKSHYDVDRSVYPIKGIDISAHNGDIDFAKVLADTVDFVLIKASEGTDFCDANFEHNYLGAKEVGLRVGAYHFFRFDTPGELQARHLLHTVDQSQLDFPLIIDVEAWGNVEHYDSDVVTENLRQMIDYITSEGYPVMIYTNKHGYNEFIAEHFAHLPLWICSLSKEPVPVKWVLWQHSHKSKVKGVPGYVDQNTFKGRKEQFESWTQEQIIVSEKTLASDSVLAQ